MAVQVIDGVRSPPEGFQNGGWYEGRQYWNGRLGPPGVIINPEQVGFGEPVSEEVQRQSFPQVPILNQPQQQQAVQPQPGISLQQSADQVLFDTYKRIVEERNRAVARYEQEKGPFNLDEVLVAKRGEAREQIDPYYNETLSDYLLGVQRKRQRSQDDTRDLLAELQATTDSFTGTTQLKLTESLNRAREGFADVGLFESGQRLRTEGLLERETGDVLSQFERRADLRRRGLETGLSRRLEDLGLESKMTERDVERRRFSDIETRAGELAGQASRQYYAGLYESLPPEVQANTGFDVLKRLNIYG